MASRYWVGGTANWDSTAGSKWALTSGGAGGQAVPGASDNVFLDSSSGANTVTKTTDTTILSLNCTGFTGTLAGSGAISLAGGNFTLVSGMTYTNSGLLSFDTASATYTITTGGKTLTNSGININANSVTMSLADNLTISGVDGNGFSINLLTSSSFTLTTNNKNLTCVSIGSQSATTGTFNMGTGTITITGSSNCCDLRGFSTINASTSTLKFTDATASDKALRLNGKTYNNIWLAPGAGTGNFYFIGATTCADIKDDGTVAHTIYFPSGTTTTFTTWNINGNSGQLISLNSATNTTPNTSTHTLSCSSGTISADYLNIQHSVAQGGATYYAGVNSTDNQATATAGSGWIFTAPPTTANSNFLMFM